MDDECFVLAFAHDVSQKGEAGNALWFDEAALAAAGVNQQTKRQRKIGLFREVADRLRPAVVVKLEIVFRQVIDELTMLVAYGGKYVDNFDVRGEGRSRRLLLLLLPLPTNSRHEGGE